MQRAQEASLLENADLETVRKGVQLIGETLYGALSNKGLIKMEALGVEFNPEQHQAIANTEDETVNVPTVAEEYQAGYILYERVLRPAMVRVAMPKASPGADLA